MRIWKSRGLVGLIVMVLLVGVVSGLVLIQQIQPAVPVSGQLVAGCSPNTSPTPTNVPLGTNGTVTFSCNSANPAGSPAFTTESTVLAVPTISGYTAPYNTSALYIYTANGAVNVGGCTSRTGYQKIENGVPESMPGNQWNYCAVYINVGPGGLPQFSVTWSLP